VPLPLIMEHSTFNIEHSTFKQRGKRCSLSVER